ncbi:MAG: hypothetical protein RIC87_08140 [Kiloniellales bacterium]
MYDFVWINYGLQAGGEGTTVAPRIYTPTKEPADWRQLLANPEKHWREGFSACCAADSWEEAGGLPQSILRLLGGEAELLLALPEHKVPLPGGGHPSQCDVFALVRRGERTLSLAIEAKVAESFGESLGRWRSKTSPGKEVRLAAICDYLGLDREPPPSIRYQLLHRTAAAVVEAKRFKTDEAAMVVQSFSEIDRGFADFQAFCRLFGHDPAPGQQVDHRLPDGRHLLLGWASEAAVGERS